MARLPIDEEEEESKPLELSSEPRPERTQYDGGTRVDLGEDLLENTAVLPIPGGHAAPPRTPVPTAPGVPSYPLGQETSLGVPPPLTGPIPLDQIADQLQSARILMGEGILEDAKRILRRILLTDSSRVEARKMLEEIHETELKQIFGESDTPRRRFRRAEPLSPIEISAEIVMRGLDRDLKLGIFGEDGGETREPRLSLFKDKAAMEAFGEQMDREFGGHPPSERIDLGVAFLEMGLYELAVRHFQAAVGQLVLTELDDSRAADPALAATGLLAYALILSGRAFDATIRLQPLLNDVEVDKLRKLDLVYLMGRAFEAMGKRAEARQWYAQADQIEPGYRDTAERLRKAGGT